MSGVDLAQLKSRGAALLHGFTRGQKTMLVVAIGAALLGAIVFLQWAAEPTWTPLYSGLPPQEAAGVTQELDAMGVDYRLEGGSTILVARDAVYQTRLDLSAKGLPADGSPGYALLDEQGITTSAFKQRVDYQRAMEGELARTIRSIDGVEAATVHLVMPEKDLFSDDAVHPTASVLVETRPDVRLDSGQVQAIVHLVAASVEGLQASDITVADGTGRMLAAPGEDGILSAAGDAQASQTAAFERGLAGSLEELITPVTGPGRVRVQVSADLDFDKRQTTTESFDAPETSPVVDEVTTNESYTGQGGAVGGVLGPDATPVAGDSAGTDYQKEQTQRSFAVGKVTEQVQTAPGRVSRLSVAVLLDEGAAVDTAAVTNLVTAAAGLSPDRGDQIEVTEMDFDESARPATGADVGPGDDGTSPLLPIARTVGTVGIIALVIFFAYRSARRSTVARYPLALQPLALQEPEAEIVEDDLLELDEVDDRALPPGLEDEVDEHVLVQAQIGDLIDRQPDDVAKVLRGWLADRRS